MRVWSFSHGSCTPLSHHCEQFWERGGGEGEERVLCVHSLPCRRLWSSKPTLCGCKGFFAEGSGCPTSGAGEGGPSSAMNGLGCMHYYSQIRVLAFGNIQSGYWRLLVERLFEFSISLCNLVNSFPSLLKSHELDFWLWLRFRSFGETDSMNNNRILPRSLQRTLWPRAGLHTMDREVGSWKRAFFNGLSLWSNFHGPTSEKISFESLADLGQLPK